jgi:uncharacterized protein (TIRG00374 family)
MAELSPAPRPGFFRRHATRFVASIVVTVCLLWALKHSGLELVPSRAAFAHVRWWTVPTYVVFIAAMSFFRGTRWRFLLRRVADHVPTSRLVSISLVGFAAILLLPFRLGEFVRPAMLREKGKVSFSAATGSIIADRIVDGLYLSIVLAIALLFVPTVVPLPEHVVGLPVTTAQVRGYAFFTLVGFAGALATIAVYFFARRFAHRATIAVFGIVSKKLAEKLAHEAERLADGLEVLRSPKDAFGYLLETTLYWGVNAAGMWFLAWGCGLEHADGSGPTFGEAAAMMGMLGITILIPGPPGLLGIFQAGLFCGMTFYYPQAIVEERGAAYAFLLFSVQVLFTLGAGAVALFAGHASLKDIAAAETDKEAEKAPVEATS